MRDTIIYEVGSTYNGWGEVKNITFNLIKRHYNICLFKRSDGYFEVIKIKNQNKHETIIAGKKVIYKEKEIYPNGDSWDGKCIANYEKALLEYENICLKL